MAAIRTGRIAWEWVADRLDRRRTCTRTCIRIIQAAQWDIPMARIRTWAVRRPCEA